jgi:hypothetical protein
MKATHVIRVALAGIFLLVAFSAQASAEIGAGTYEIEGKSAKAKKYKGTITIMPGKDVVYATKRVYGKTQRGIGFKQGRHVALVFGKGISIALYQGGYAADKYTGVWTRLGADGLLGSEEAAQQEGEAAYVVTGKSPKGESYQGTLTIDDDAGVAVAKWKLGNREMCGVGTSDLRGSQALVLGIGKKPHVWLYSEEEDGTLSGYVIGKVGKRFGTEYLTAVGPVKQLERLAKAACACKVKSCAEAGLATLSELYHTYKDAMAEEKALKKVEKASAKTARCLVKKGVTQEQLKAALP